jgi:hypothetical protein
MQSCRHDHVDECGLDLAEYGLRTGSVDAFERVELSVVSMGGERVRCHRPSEQLDPDVP